MPSSATKSENHPQKPGDAVSSQVSVLAVGDWKKREFATVASEIHGIDSWQMVGGIDSAGQFLAGDTTPPELIILAQSIPGEYRQEDVDQLSELAPLSRIIVVAGTWCEGEMRTGTWLGGTLRLYWYELAPWWQTALEKLAAGLCPPWSFPLDNPQAGRFLPAEPSGLKPLTGTVVIDAADFYAFEALAAALTGVGIKTFWPRHSNSTSLPPDTSAGIWDGGQLSQTELQRLKAFCQKIQASQGKVVALLDFPRVEHIEQTRAAGASAVFGKPYPVDEVISALQ